MLLIGITKCQPNRQQNRLMSMNQSCGGTFGPALWTMRGSNRVAGCRNSQFGVLNEFKVPQIKEDRVMVTRSV
ncbi:MAG: hypothetical protein CMJ78_12170 [Planctomycetaceae bacterium]|nr:hypothetical protein [Planctomycetaceae bacterium]